MNVDKRGPGLVGEKEKCVVKMSKRVHKISPRSGEIWSSFSFTSLNSTRRKG